MQLPLKMSGIILKCHGDYDCLEWRDDLNIPKLSDTDVLVKVGAAAVNNTDLNTRIAWYSKGDVKAKDASWGGTPLSFPRIQGADVCGKIVAVGSLVDKSRIGDRVIIEPCLQEACLLYTSPSPRDKRQSRMPSSA